MRHGEVWLVIGWNCAVFSHPIHKGEQILTSPRFQGFPTTAREHGKGLAFLELDEEPLQEPRQDSSSKNEQIDNRHGLW